MELVTSSSSLLSGLGDAYDECMTNHTFTPLLKCELKYKILMKRLNEGREEIKVDFTPKPSYELTEEEVQKQGRRREVNRKAAKKFRQKKKNHIEKLLEKVRQLETDNRHLEEEVRQLRRLSSVESQSPGVADSSVVLYYIVSSET